MQAKLLRHSKYLFLVFILLISCKKDKLDGDSEILVGKWHWVYTIYEYDKCQQNGGYVKTLNPTTENTTYQMEFFKKGKVKFYENEIEKSEFRLVVPNFAAWNGYQTFYDNMFRFSIFLDNDKNKEFSGLVSKDSILTYHRPYYTADSPCNDYVNYWGK